MSQLNPDATLSREQIEQIRAEAKQLATTYGDEGPLRNWWRDVQILCDLALRTLPPASQEMGEFPEIAVRYQCDLWHGKQLDYVLAKDYDALLARYRDLEARRKG